MEADASGRVVKRGEFKVWTGAVPATPIEEAVEHSRHYTRRPYLVSFKKLSKMAR